jgi:hypothetical protein
LKSWGKNGERFGEKKMHAMRGSKDLYSRILGGIGKGSEGQTHLQYFNLAMENVLKGLPDKISCPYIIKIDQLIFRNAKEIYIQ